MFGWNGKINMVGDIMTLNKNRLDYLGITHWHNKGFKGQGIKIASFEHDNIASGEDHGANVLDVVKQIIPDGQAVARQIPLLTYRGGRLTPQSYNNLKTHFKSLVVEGVNVVTMSLSIKTGYEDSDSLMSEILHPAGIPCFASAGNETPSLSTQAKWISVGAYALTQHGSVIKAHNTQDGNIASLTNFILTRTGTPFTHTSGATPVAAAMTGLLIQIFNEYNGRYPTYQEILDIIFANINQHGIFILPKEIPVLEVSMKKEFIIFHHTGAEETDAEHVRRNMMSNGFRDIGYNYVIERDGKIVVGRPLDIIGGHTRGIMNRIGIGVAVIGNLSERNPTPEQTQSLIKLTSDLMFEHGIPIENVLEHKKVPNQATECAGKNFPYNYVISEVLKRMTIKKTDYKGHWAEKNIDLVIKHNLMGGYPDGTWQPNKAITRAEMATILVRALNLK